jgi:hypothetical protein
MYENNQLEPIESYMENSKKHLQKVESILKINNIESENKM